jgi:hypothetical protein
VTSYRYTIGGVHMHIDIESHPVPPSGTVFVATPYWVVNRGEICPVLKDDGKGFAAIFGASEMKAWNGALNFLAGRLGPPTVRDEHFDKNDSWRILGQARPLPAEWINEAILPADAS